MTATTSTHNSCDWNGYNNWRSEHGQGICGKWTRGAPISTRSLPRPHPRRPRRCCLERAPAGTEASCTHGIGAQGLPAQCCEKARRRWEEVEGNGKLGLFEKNVKLNTSTLSTSCGTARVNLKATAGVRPPPSSQEQKVFGPSCVPVRATEMNFEVQE